MLDESETLAAQRESRCGVCRQGTGVHFLEHGAWHCRAKQANKLADASRKLAGRDPDQQLRAVGCIGHRHETAAASVLISPDTAYSRAVSVHDRLDPITPGPQQSLCRSRHQTDGPPATAQ
jgi:hypothetical protein